MEQNERAGGAPLERHVGPLLDRLRAGCTDWDGSEMVDETQPMDCLTVGDVRDAVTEIQRLRAELQHARDGLTKGRSRMREDIEGLRAELARFTPLRAKGVVDADDNLDCWDTNPYEICTRHVAALNEKDPAAMWRVVQLFARDEAVPGA